MGSNIRPATSADAPKWLELVQAAIGSEYPVKELYDLNWISSQLDPQTGHETWVIENGGNLTGSISFLKAEPASANPIANLGRNIFRPEALADSSADALIRSVNQLVADRKQMAVARVSAADNAQQALFENLGYICVGFQPLKHLLQKRIGTLFYVRPDSGVLGKRQIISESLPQVAELAAAALEKLQISNTMAARDGIVGYPLQTDLKVHEATADDFELWRMQAQSANPAVEVSGRFNLGFGLMRMPATVPLKALFGQNDTTVVGGMSFYFDEHDRCARITEAFSTDDVCLGPLLQHTVKMAQEQLGAVYTEVDILITSPRLLKTAEQLGFVPVAYMPAFFVRGDSHVDVVKMVKLNLPYSLDNCDFTAHAKAIVKVIDRNFEDQKVGMAIINLLRPLSMFKGLGDGELRKVARLFTQKLYRPGDELFAKDDAGEEAYIVLRGKINILLERGATPVAALTDGKIFGELAFLDGSPRIAFASAAQPSILLVVHRNAFADLTRREPALGMVVMRNLALDMATKLRSTDAALAAARANK